MTRKQDEINGMPGLIGEISSLFYYNRYSGRSARAPTCNHQTENKRKLVEYSIDKHIKIGFMS